MGNVCVLFKMAGYKYVEDSLAYPTCGVADSGVALVSKEAPF